MKTTLILFTRSPDDRARVGGAQLMAAQAGCNRVTEEIDECECGIEPCVHPSTVAGEQLETPHRVEVRSDHNFLELPLPVIFGGQLYLPLPLHLRAPILTSPTSVEIPYVLAVAYDLELDHLAERVYTPAEASDLVERVREPLDLLVSTIDRVSADDKRPIGQEVIDSPEVLEALGGTRQILAQLRPVEDDGEGDEWEQCGKPVEGSAGVCLLEPEHAGDCEA